MISIIFPLHQAETKAKIKRSLDSLVTQTYQNFEVIVVTFPTLAKKYRQLFKKYPFVRVVSGHWNKSQARNQGAQASRGQYLFHFDADMRLSTPALAEFNQKAKKGAQTIIIPVKGEKKVNFWGQCRNLEKELLLGDEVLETPLFIEKSLFDRLNGFDETLDPLDDWGLHLALQKRKVKFGRIKNPVYVYESPSLKEVWQRLYHRGQALPALQEKYPQLPQVNLKKKMEMYLKKWRLFFASPLTSLGFVFLKIVDWLAFWWGNRHPLRPYLLEKTANAYDKERSGSNYVRYKHFAECQSLFQFLGSKPGKILEIGCGTGRITAELVKKGHQVTPTDPSKEMLKEYRRKKSLPPARQTSGENLPFNKAQFATVLALRVFWHLPYSNQEQLLKEMSRVSSKEIIFDMVNPQRFLAGLLLGPLTYPLSLKKLNILARKKRLKIKEALPLEVSLPFWLNLLPQPIADKIFPLLYRLDLKLAKIIPPGRYLVKLYHSLR